MEKSSIINRHCELCRFWGYKVCPYDTLKECEEARNDKEEKQGDNGNE